MKVEMLFDRRIENVLEMDGVEPHDFFECVEYLWEDGVDAEYGSVGYIYYLYKNAFDRVGATFVICRVKWYKNNNSYEYEFKVGTKEELEEMIKESDYPEEIRRKLSKYKTIYTVENLREYFRPYYTEASLDTLGI